MVNTNPDIERAQAETDPAYLANAMRILEKRAQGIARMMGNMSRPVDEYLGNASTSEGVSTIEVLPQFEQMAERITAIIVAGPPGAQGNLQLGDRNWPITIPNSGVLDISPVSLLLNRSDRRILTINGTNYNQQVGSVNTFLANNTGQSASFAAGTDYVTGFTVTANPGTVAGDVGIVLNQVTGGPYGFDLFVPTATTATGPASLSVTFPEPLIPLIGGAAKLTVTSFTNGPTGNLSLYGSRLVATLDSPAELSLELMGWADERY